MKQIAEETDRPPNPSLPSPLRRKNGETIVDTLFLNFERIVNTPVLLSDAIYAVVQPTRQVAAAKVVRGTSRQTQKKNHTRIDNDDSRPKAENVEFSRVEGC